MDAKMLKLLELVKPKKTTRPLLSDMALFKDRIEVTDLDISLTVPFNSNAEKDCIIDFAIFKASKGASFRQIDDISNWPVLPNTSKEFKKVEGLREALNSVGHAMSKDETRLFLCGVYFELTSIVATDGHRLSKYGIITGLEGILPRKAVDILSSKHFDIVEATHDDDYFYFKAANGAFMSARKIKREYVKYKSIVPTKYNAHCMIGKNDVVNAVKPFLKLISKSKAVKIKGVGEKIEISGHDCNGVPLFNTSIFGRDSSDKGIEIAFNAGYLLDVVEACENDTITFWYISNKAPVNFSNKNEIELLMPLKL